LLRIKKIHSTALHPESQWSIERSHRVLVKYLQNYVKEDQADWDEWVPFATFAYNTSEHSATGYMLFQLVFGHSSSLPSALKTEASPQYNYDDNAADLKGQLQATHRLAKDNLIGSKH
jgi:hypothetical protein